MLAVDGEASNPIGWPTLLRLILRQRPMNLPKHRKVKQILRAVRGTLVRHEIGKREHRNFHAAQLVNLRPLLGTVKIEPLCSVENPYLKRIRSNHDLRSRFPGQDCLSIRRQFNAERLDGFYQSGQILATPGDEDFELSKPRTAMHRNRMSPNEHKLNAVGKK